MNENFDISGERSIPDKITALKNMAKSYEMKMRGFKLDTANDKWVISGKALAGSDLIIQSTGIILSFAENANLMTSKSPEKFMMEFADAFYRINVAILNDMATPASTYRSVIKMYKDTLSNIGDIITVSRETMQKVFNNYELKESGDGEY